MILATLTLQVSWQLGSCVYMVVELILSQLYSGNQLTRVGSVVGTAGVPGEAEEEEEEPEARRQRMSRPAPVGGKRPLSGWRKDRRSFQWLRTQQR